ncbi:MAG: diguanylate cyclase [Desulfobulbaceae bacterium]|nr:diguanylate cyclase [Desulfobulbaceae bacterium]
MDYGLENIDYSRERVLVVDDEEAVRVPVTEMLRHLGFQADGIGNPLKALAAFEENAYSFLLTDVRMPEMDGLALIKQIKERFPEVFAIAMTGYAREYSYVEVINVGATDFINKPFGMEELEAKFKRALIERNIRKELNRLSITDSLTGIFNQRHFYNKLNDELMRAKRQRCDLGLILLDLDNFKKYNDQFGHFEGDNLLRSIGPIITQSIRHGVDSGFRYGGDEFAVILIDGTPEIAELTSKRIMDSIEKTCGIYASAGYAVTSGEISMEDFIKEADEALYRNKKQTKTEALKKLEQIISV